MSECCGNSTKLTSNQVQSPGYRSPLDAKINGSRETVLFVTCVRPNMNGPDYLATVDVDPQSPSYGKVIDRLEFGFGDEVHHTVS